MDPDESGRADVSIGNVPLLSQRPELPTGCEATALAMLLGWAGLDVTKEAAAERMAREPAPFLREGRRVGGDPERAFVGDPWSEKGFGAYHGVIARALGAVSPGKALDLTGSSLDDALAPLRSETPVLAWCTLDLREPRVTDRWQDIDSPKRTIRWTSPEHCVLVVGRFSDGKVIVHDPHTGRCERWPRSLFERRWRQMGRQAVTLER